MNLLDHSPAKKFIFSKRGLTFVISLILGSVLTVLILLNFLPFGKDIFNQLFPKPPAKAAGVLNEPLLHYTVTDGSVAEIQLPNDNIAYIGGNFKQVGLDTGSAAPVSASSGLPVPPYLYPDVSNLDASFSRFNTAVNVSVPDGFGGWFLGGSFNTVGSLYNRKNGINRNNLVHVLSNGTIDPNFNPNPDGEIMGLFLHPDKATLYVGGEFANIGGQPRSLIAALDVTTGLATSFNPGADGVPETFDLSSNCEILYVGGRFRNIGGQARNHLAAINLADGTVTSFNPNTDRFGEVHKIILSGSTLYVGGNFNSIGGKIRNYIGAVDVTTGLPTDFDPNADQEVFSMALTPDGKTLYAGGSFRSIAGQTRIFVAGLDTATGAVTDFDPNINPCQYCGLQPIALSNDGSTLFMGGQIDKVGGQVRPYAAAANTQTSAVTSFDPSPDSYVRSLTVSPDNQTVYIGGNFFHLDWRERNNAASFDTRTGHVTSFNPNFGGPYGGDITRGALSPDKSTWFVLGNFKQVGGWGGPIRTGFAAFDLTTNTLAPFHFDMGYKIAHS